MDGWWSPQINERARGCLQQSPGEDERGFVQRSAPEAGLFKLQRGEAQGSLRGLKASGMKAASLLSCFAHLKGFVPRPWPAGVFCGWKRPPRDPLRSLEWALGADTHAQGRNRCSQRPSGGTAGDWTRPVQAPCSGRPQQSFWDSPAPRGWQGAASESPGEGRVGLEGFFPHL